MIQTGQNRVMSFFRTVPLNNDVLDFIVHTSQLVNKDLLQGKGQHIKIGRVCFGDTSADLLGIAHEVLEYAA